MRIISLLGNAARVNEDDRTFNHIRTTTHPETTELQRICSLVFLCYGAGASEWCALRLKSRFFRYRSAYLAMIDKF